MKNAEWTPAMVEKAARRIRRGEGMMNIPAVLLSLCAGVLVFLALVLMVSLLFSKGSYSLEYAGSGDVTGIYAASVSVFRFELRLVLWIAGALGTLFLGIVAYAAISVMLEDAMLGLAVSLSPAVPGRSAEWTEKAGELLSFLEKTETKERLLSSLLAKDGEIAGRKFHAVEGMDDENKYSLMCDLYGLEYLLELEKGK